MLARYANEQKILQPNLKNIDEYLRQILGGKKNLSPKVQNDILTLTQHKIGRSIDNMEDILAARSSLMKKTGKKKFTQSEIAIEIDLFNKELKNKEK